MTSGPEQSRGPARISVPARRDIVAIIRWSRKHFGEAAALRYEELIMQALLDIQQEPARLGSKERLELMPQGLRTYHLEFSQNHVSGDRVRTPRHLLMYRVRFDGVVEVGRALHDSRDLARHLPVAFR